MDIVIALTYMYLYFGLLCFSFWRKEINTSIDYGDEGMLFFLIFTLAAWPIFLIFKR